MRRSRWTRSPPSWTSTGRREALAVLPNGGPDLLASIVDRAGIADLLSGVVSADEIRAHEPATAIDEHAAERTDMPVEPIGHAATPWYDVCGAMGAGEPSLVVDSMAGLAAGFDA